MKWPLVHAIVLLPRTALIFIPAAVLWLSRSTVFAARIAKRVKLPP